MGHFEAIWACLPDERNTEKCGLGIHGGLVVRIPGFYYCGLASVLGQGTKIPRAVWPGPKKKSKVWLRIVIVPGVGRGCLSFSCSSGSKDRIAAVCVILQILNACCLHEPQEI